MGMKPRVSIKRGEDGGFVARAHGGAGVRSALSPSYGSLLEENEQLRRDNEAKTHRCAQQALKLKALGTMQSDYEEAVRTVKSLQARIKELTLANARQAERMGELDRQKAEDAEVQGRL